MLPKPALNSLAHSIALLVFHVIKYRRDVALDNLACAFPEKSDTERYAIAFNSYKHFALLIIEFMKMSSFTPEDLDKMVKIEKTPEVNTILKESKEKGTILVSGHFGNWEIAIALLATKYFESVSAIQARQRNYIVDKYIADKRRRWGIDLIYSRGAVTNALSAVGKNRLLGLLPDQDGGKRGVFVPFLGRMASTPVGAATLHLRSKSTLIFGCCLRTAPFQFKGYLVPLNIDSDLPLNRENAQIVTTRFTAELEKYIRQHPEQYLWMHRRWKTKPPENVE